MFGDSSCHIPGGSQTATAGKQKGFGMRRDDCGRRTGVHLPDITGVGHGVIKLVDAAKTTAGTFFHQAQAPAIGGNGTHGKRPAGTAHGDNQRFHWLASPASRRQKPRGGRALASVATPHLRHRAADGVRRAPMVTIRGRIMVGYLGKVGEDPGQARESPAAGWREHTPNGAQRQSAEKPTQVG
jgi:hypothetical protein